MNAVPRYHFNPTFNSDVRNIASQLSYGMSRKTIVANLVANGRTTEQAHLLVRAAELYLKWKENPMIDDRMKIMQAAVSRGGAPSYLFDRDTLVRWELAGLVYLARQHTDFDVYKATDAGRAAFAKAQLP
jgi:hypothetical protein